MDKIEFMNKFFIGIVQIINDELTQLINQLADEPGGSQHSKQLHEEKAMPPPKTTETNSVAKQNSINLHQTHERIRSVDSLDQTQRILIESDEKSDLL